MISFRKANKGDLEFIFNLRNEEAVRLASFNSDPIDFEVHSKWFPKILASDSSVIFIAELDGKPIGQVRFDFMGDDVAEVNIAVTQNYCGKGHGSKILKESAKKFFNDSPVIKKLYALIKPDNKSSIHAFEKAGYEFHRNTQQKGCNCVEMILNRH